MNIHSPRRILGLDLARAVAVAGMVVVNYRIVMSGLEPASGLSASLEHFVEGKAVALFIVLAGIGATLGSRRVRQGSPQDRRKAQLTLGKRALFLYLFGWLFMLVWPADILHFYGLFLLCGAILLFQKTQILVGVGIGAWAVGFIYLVGGDFFRDWNLVTLSYEGLDTWSGFFKSQFFNGFHPFFPWVTFYLVGMVVGRLDLRDPKIQGRILGFSSLVFAVFLGLSWSFTKGLDLAMSPETFRMLLLPTPLPPMPIYPIIGSSAALVVLALCLRWGDWIARTPRSNPHPLVATGQLAFTLYVAHVMVGMATLESQGLLYGQTVDFAVSQALLFFVLSVVFATIWRRYFRRGPLEWLMRWSTSSSSTDREKRNQSTPQEGNTTPRSPKPLVKSSQG